MLPRPGLARDLRARGRPARALGDDLDPVRDVHAEHARLAAAAVPIARGPATEPWGLTEMWIQDRDGIQTVLVEVPADHPLRRRPAIGLTATMTNAMPQMRALRGSADAFGPVRR